MTISSSFLRRLGDVAHRILLGRESCSRSEGLLKTNSREVAAWKARNARNGGTREARNARNGCARETWRESRLVERRLLADVGRLRAQWGLAESRNGRSHAANAGKSGEGGRHWHAGLSLETGGVGDGVGEVGRKASGHSEGKSSELSDLWLVGAVEGVELRDSALVEGEGVEVDGFSSLALGHEAAIDSSSGHIVAVVLGLRFLLAPDFGVLDVDSISGDVSLLVVGAKLFLAIANEEDVFVAW